MKFVLNSITTCSSRFGSIKEIERLPGLVLETPLLLLYTKGGSVPHLTHEVLQMVSTETQPLHVPIATLAHCHEALASFKKGIAHFIGLKEHLTYCTIHDVASATPQGFNDKDTVSLWSRCGRRQIDADKYMDMIEAFQPDMYHTLCDGDTNNKSSKKRIQKSVNRTDSMFDKCLQRHNKSEVLKKSAVLGVVEGGFSVEAREKSAREVGASPVFGCVIDGLHNNGPEVEKLQCGDVRPVLEATLKHLPQEKLRVVHGCWNPETVLSMVEMGVDAFDSSFTYTVTERGGALVFHNKLELPDAAAEPPSKRLCSAAVNGCGEEKKSGEDRKFELSLSDKRYADDFAPISSSCSCLTCRKHTRAYIHHLLQTNELLAPVLLSIHNLHHYLEFFKSIRESLRTDSLDRLKQSVATCLS